MRGIDSLDFIFNPRSIAITGVTTNDAVFINIGRVYLDSLMKAGFAGQLYSINPRGGEVRGKKAYASVKDVPGPLDYVICCSPARTAPQVIQDSVAKGVKAVQMFCSGFSETGTEEGKRLEAEIGRLAHQGNVRLIGPNCMGVYCPKTGMTFAVDFPKESGRVGYICQSGGNAMYFIRMVAQRGIYFSKVVSYGNACDIDESELLEYFTADTETDIVLMYVEGVKDGKRFKRALEKAVRTKPVIVFKGGNTEDGARAAASHTGALAGSAAIWDALMRQVGAIPVHSLDEMVDIIITFQYLPVPRGRRLGTVGLGGGATVMATDIYASAELVLPPFPRTFQQKLKSFVPDIAGLSLNNPVDLSAEHFGMAIYNVGKAVAEYDGIDALVFHLPFSIVPIIFAYPESVMFGYLDHIIRIRKETTIPMAVVFHNLPNGEVWQVAFNCQRKCHEVGIPAYFSIEAAARALRQYIGYHKKSKIKFQKLK